MSLFIFSFSVGFIYFIVRGFAQCLKKHTDEFSVKKNIFTVGDLVFIIVGIVGIIFCGLLYVLLHICVVIYKFIMFIFTLQITIKTTKEEDKGIDLRENKNWNKGFCNLCNSEWSHTDYDSQGGRCYKCSCGNSVRD